MKTEEPTLGVSPHFYQYSDETKSYGTVSSGFLRKTAVQKKYVLVQLK